jgi:thiol:disulfide interchange protein/DsbC/DsbD-like thiol-disulfide interchange protein
MRPLHRFVTCAAALGLTLGSALAPVAAATPPDSPRARLDLVSEQAAIAPGGAVWLGIRQRIAPGWHTYWLNPGDSGEPLSMEWALPAGFRAEPIVWPHPERIPVGPAMSHGYTDEAVLLVRVTAPADAREGTTITLGGRASLLVCEKICIPEEQEIALTLPVRAGPIAPSPDAPVIARARRAVPVASPWPATIAVSPERVVLSFDARGLAAERVQDVWFYPTAWGLVEPAGRQEARVDSRGITLTLARGALPTAGAGAVDGVLVMKERIEGQLVSQAFAVRAEPRGAAAAGAPTVAGAVGLALLGGLILNLMPCVLPVLSVKALALLQHADASPATMRRHGLAHTAGVLACFGVLAGALLLLRAGGAGVGWGFQLQSPLMIAALAYLFFAMALALSGVLVLGGRLAGLGGTLAARPGYGGSFFTGALVAVAATPCTAPFMGVATGFALTQPPAVALAIFLALGAGLALPFLALSVVPGWRRHLPRPGPWMERLKQLLAFPLYATVAWLVWVASAEAGSAAAAALLAGLVLIAFAAWLHGVGRETAGRRRRLVTATALASALAALALVPLTLGGPAPVSDAAAAGGVPWEPWSPRRLAEARAEGRPVFVNFTAAWCITCLVNERVALRSPAVAEAFARRQVVYLKADWTNRNADIAAALEGFGRSGVPLYVVYPRQRAGAGASEPIVLPPILTEGTVLDAVEGI